MGPRSSIAVNAASTPTDTPTVEARTVTEASKGTTDAVGRGIRLIRRLVLMNLALVALQPISAGFFLSGYGYARAVTIHGVVGLALLLGALVQAVTAVVQRRRRHVPSWVASVSIGLFVIVFLQVGLGYNRWHWLHVPIGVGIFGGLIRQASRLDILCRATEGRS
jgi:hypothetical protein